MRLGHAVSARSLDRRAPNMLARRFASAVVGIPLLLMVILAGGKIFDAVLALVLAAAVAELLLQAGSPVRRFGTWLAPAGVAALALAATAGPEWPTLILTL